MSDMGTPPDTPVRKGVKIWGLIAIAALLALVQFATLPAQPRILSVINNFAHGPVFGVLAILLLGWLRPRFASRPWCAYAAAWLLAVAAGIALEVLQISTRRDASVEDVFTNMLGAGCFLSLAAYFDRSIWPSRPRSRPTLLLIAGGIQLLVMLVPVGHALLAYASRMERFPTIMQFTSVLDMYFIELRGCEEAVGGPSFKVSGPAGEPALWLRCYGNDWPGVSSIEPSPDWRRFDRLRIDVTNPGANEIALGLRIHDIGNGQEYEDRFNREFAIGAGTREVLVVNLEDIASSPANRTLDLARIGGLVLFRVSPATAQQVDFILTRVWLE
jgi:VanZ family protein